MNETEGIPWELLGGTDWACIVLSLALIGLGIFRLTRGDGSPFPIVKALPRAPFPDALMPLVAVTAFILTFGILVGQPAFLISLATSLVNLLQLDSSVLLGGQFDGTHILAGLLGQLLAVVALLGLARLEPTLLHTQPDSEAAEPLGFKLPSCKRWVELFAAGTALMAGSMLVWGLFKLSAEAQGLTLPTDLQQMVEALLNHSGAVWPVVVTGIYVGLGAPLIEEIGFRGMIYPALRRTLPRGWAVALTGLVFAAIHGNLAALLPITVLGAWLCLVRDRFGLTTCIVLHMMVNLWSFTWLLAAPNVARHF